MNLKSQPYKVHEDVCVFSISKHSYYPIMVEQKPRVGKTYSRGEANGIKNYGDTRTYDKKYPKSILEVSNADQRGRLHPTQKPVALMEYFIQTYTQPGDLVLDNTMGSGTTGVACALAGRRFVGIEKDANIYAAAEIRVDEAYASSK